MERRRKIPWKCSVSKSQIRSLDRANERDYIEIGKKIYEKFKAGEVADLEYIAPVRINRKERGRSSTVPGGDTQDSGGIADVIDGSRRTSRCAGVRGHGH